MQDAAITASGDDWESASSATGDADGREAHSPNVDAGEILRATAFDVCDPEGEEQIEHVELAVLARTQYDSGTYALNLLLDASGSTYRVFTGTTATWHVLDISEEEDWTWESLAGLTARVSLHDHPGGARDSDAWVDAFRLHVTYTASGGGSNGRSEDSGPGDTGGDGSQSDTAEPGDGEGTTDSGRDAAGSDGSRSAEVNTGCSVGGGLPIGAPWIAFALLFGRTHRFRAPMIFRDRL